MSDIENENIDTSESEDRIVALHMLHKQAPPEEEEIPKEE